MPPQIWAEERLAFLQEQRAISGLLYAREMQRQKFAKLTCICCPDLISKRFKKKQQLARECLRTSWLSSCTVLCLRRKLFSSQWRHWQVVNISGEVSICTRPFISRTIALGAKQHGQTLGSSDEHVKMVQNFIEFVLLKEQIQSKFTLVEKRVNSLFDVQLKRTKEEDNLRCWVKLEGSEHDIGRAKVRERKSLVSLHFDFN